VNVPVEETKLTESGVPEPKQKPPKVPPPCALLEKTPDAANLGVAVLQPIKSITKPIRGPALFKSQAEALFVGICESVFENSTIEPPP
jgi:hypothetical protein